jgi:hypothetical protein
VQEVFAGRCRLKLRNFAIKFLSTLKTDPVRPFPDREHTAYLAVMAKPECKLENPQQEFYEF